MWRIHEWLTRLTSRRHRLISVIVPAYNEEETITEVLRRLIKLQSEIKMEIVLIDDGSTDGTARIAEEFPVVKTIRHNKNCGKGAAIKTALKHVTGEVVVIQDADLEYPPENILRIIDPIIRDQADVVYGSRFLGQNERMSISHEIGNRILSTLASVLYGTKITDVMTGHKAISQRAVSSIELTENEFEVEVEITAKLLLSGFRLLEVPIPYCYRRKGLSKISYRHAFTSVTKLLVERVKNLTGRSMH